MTEPTIVQRLYGLQDPAYQAFQRRLLPNLAPETILGVRTPPLRALAKELSGRKETEAFLHDLPHKYYDENQLHAFLLERISDYETASQAVDAFLPYVDNWATCDQMCPKVFGAHKEAFLEQIQIWIQSERPYTVRYAIGMLMRFYLDDAFSPLYPSMVAAVSSEEYYVKMMVAWYFATALSKQWDAVIPYVREHRLDEFTHRKTIAKAVESYRISQAQKDYLRTLRS